MSIVITAQDTAKLADLGPCVKLPQKKEKEMKQYDMYSPEPQYVNMAGWLTLYDFINSLLYLYKTIRTLQIT